MALTYQRDFNFRSFEFTFYIAAYGSETNMTRHVNLNFYSMAKATSLNLVDQSTTLIELNSTFDRL